VECRDRNPSEKFPTGEADHGDMTVGKVRSAAIPETTGETNKSNADAALMAAGSIARRETNAQMLRPPQQMLETCEGPWVSAQACRSGGAPGLLELGIRRRAKIGRKSTMKSRPNSGDNRRNKRKSTMASTNNNGARAVEAQRVCSASSQQNEVRKASDDRRHSEKDEQGSNYKAIDRESIATNSNEVSRQIDNGAGRCGHEQFTK
jgi:hypothetical protein